MKGKFPLYLSCRSQFRLITPPVCQKCGQPLGGPPGIVFTCILCRRRWAITCPRAPGVYNGALRDAVHALKFGGCRAMAEPLGRLMAAVAAADPMLKDAEVIVPVPLHPARLRERGFNQAELLARVMARALHRPVQTDLLRRLRPTAAQSGLDASRRSENVREAFEARVVRVSSILLVDDVISTGATGSECALALRQAGATSVGVVAAALAVLD